MDSRFIWRFTIESYDYKELMNIFVKLMEQHEWSWYDNENELEKLSWFERNKDSFVFFGRDMESLFTYVKISHGKRIYGKEEEYKKKITMEDLMITKDKGIAEGVSNIFIENMNKLSLYQRPIHCTDVKGEIVYIKSDDDGEKFGMSKDLKGEFLSPE